MKAFAYVVLDLAITILLESHQDYELFSFHYVAMVIRDATLPFIGIPFFSPLAPKKKRIHYNMTDNSYSILLNYYIGLDSTIDLDYSSMILLRTHRFNRQQPYTSHRHLAAMPWRPPETGVWLRWPYTRYSLMWNSLCFSIASSTFKKEGFSIYRRRA